jgi:formate dehydrogenase maturation protein FdhE
MAFYSAPEIAHVRVDVCDTCHTYLKSIDLTKTGLAVAVVDELATIPLDLWAREHGYEKLQINLLELLTGLASDETKILPAGVFLKFL